ncbi:hypothetical protein Patl1_26529 [Pistacia atlantica]|uniref:Uncharacterized protein n=1 Tax=Pistacia atlantica TaxID=434234 RepID=A0ACC1B3T1_9ROSI|nr:hypothetical protein Patl1_26529 [Pistacia atlantica]
MKTRWGITKFINLRTFSNPLNGYLVDDTSIFGAEVFVVKNTFPGECLSTMSDPPTYYHTWEIENFSTLQNDRYESETFGCYKWKILFCPKRCKEGKGNSISLILDVTRSSKTMDIFEVRLTPILTKADYLYTSSNLALGFIKFSSLAKLEDLKNGYLVGDIVVVEAAVTLLGLVVTEL